EFSKPCDLAKSGGQATGLKGFVETARVGRSSLGGEVAGCGGHGLGPKLIPYGGYLSECCVSACYVGLVRRRRAHRAPSRGSPGRGRDGLGACEPGRRNKQKRSIH